MHRQAPLPRPFGRSLELQRPPLCEEIALWLLAGHVDLEAECRALHEGEPPPYWAFCWGSGQALARWLLDHPSEVWGRRVVDFGCGSGVAGIAALLAGADQVVAVDPDPHARRAVLANAAANGISERALRAASTPPDDWQVLLAADLLYEPGLALAIDALRARAETRGARLLAGEPERPGNPGHPAPVLARYPVRTWPDVDSPTTAARVYRLGG